MVTTTRYIYDGFQLLGEADETNEITRLYTNEPDEYTLPIGHTDVATGESSYYHFDGLGNTRAVTDGNENVTDTFTYDSWGNLLSRTGMTNVPFQFGGEHGYYKDEELDTYYVMARVYDPTIIRWLSADPLQFVDGLNLYLYVMNGPMRGVDPSGLRIVGDTDKCPKAMGDYRRCIQKNGTLYAACVGLALGPTAGVEVSCAALCRWLGKSAPFAVCFGTCSIFGLANFLCNKSICDEALDANGDKCGNKLNRDCLAEGGLEPWRPDP